MRIALLFPVIAIALVSCSGKKSAESIVQTG